MLRAIRKGVCDVKKIILFLYSLLLMLVLCACSEVSATYTVEKSGIVFEVNTENCTISDGTHVYQYTFTGDTESYAVKITYPNGSTYYWNRSGMHGSGGWSDDYDGELYVDGDTLCDVVAAKAPSPDKSVIVFVILFLLAVGVFNAANPQAAWHLSHGWRYKNAEPSEAALVVARVGGIAACVIAVLMIFV